MNDLVIKIRLEDGALVVNGIKDISHSVDGMGNSAKRAIADIAHLGGAFVVFQQAAGSLTGAARALDEYTTAASRIDLVARSVTAAASAQSGLFKIAQDARVEYASLAETYTRLARSGNELGISQGRMLGVTKSISQAMTIGGGAAESMKAALIQLSQGFASGTLRGEELNSVMEQTPRLAQAIAEGMGKSVGELKALGEAGKLTADVIMTALEKQAPALAAEFAKMTPTISQAFTVLKDGASKAFYEFDKGAGTSASLANAMNGLGHALGEAGEQARQFGEKYGTAIKTVGEIAAILVAKAAGSKLLTVLGGLARFAANPLVIGVSLVVSGTSALDHLVNETESGLTRQLEAAEKRLAVGRAGLEANKTADAATSSAMQAGIRSDEKAIASLTARLQALRVEVAANSPTAKASAAMRQSDRDWEAEQRATEEGPKIARKKAFDAYMADARSAKEKATTEENDKWKSLSSLLIKGSAEYTSAQTAHNAKLAEINKSAANGSGAKNDLAQTYSAALAAEKEFTKTEVTLVEERIKQRQIAESDGVNAILALQENGYLEQVRLLQEQISKTKDLGDIDKLRKQITAAGLDMTEAATKAATARNKLSDIELKHQQEWMKGIGDETAILLEKAKAAELENAQIGLTGDQLAVLTAKRYDDLIAKKEDLLLSAQQDESRQSEVAYIEMQIDALKRLKNAEIAKPKLTEQAQEWKKFTDDIERSLTDSLYRSFEASKGYGETFIKSLANTLKAASLKLVIQYAVTGSGNLVASAANSVLGTSFSTDNTSTLGNYLSGASNLNTAYNVANGSYLNTAMQGWNNYVAGTNVGGYTAPAWGTSTGTGSSSLFAPTATESAIDSGILGGTATQSTGMGSSAWATMLEGGWVALIPLIGKALFGSTERYLDTNIEGTLGSSGFTGQFGDRYKTTGNVFGAVSPQTDWYPVTNSSADIAGAPAFTQKSAVNSLMAPTELGGYSAETQAMLDESLSSQLASIAAQSAAFKGAFEGIYNFSKTSLLNIAGMFEDSTLPDKIKDYAVAVDLQFSGSVDKVFADFGETVMVGMGGAWLPSVEALRASGETWSQAMVRLVNESGAVGQIFLAMGTTLKEVFGPNNTDGILKFSDSLIKTFGTVDALNASFSSYFGNFYSAAEVSEKQWEGMTAQFAALNLPVAKTREEFRALVEGLDKTAPSYAASFKGLMDLNAGFAALVPATADAAKAVDALVDTAGRKSWTDKLALLKGETTQRELDLAAASDTVVRALMRQVFAQEDLATAATAAAEALAAHMQIINELGIAAQTSALDQYNAALQRSETGISDQINAQKALSDSFKATVLNIKKYRDSLTLGALSTLDPGEKYTEAKRLYSLTSAKAQLGDKDALGELPSIAQDFLTASREYNASSETYAADYQSVLDSLDKSSATATRQAANADQALTSLNASSSSAAKSLMSIDAAMVGLVNAVVNAARSGGTTDAAALAAMNAAGMTNKVLGVGADASYLSSRGAQAYVDGAGQVAVTGLTGLQFTQAQFKAEADKKLGAGDAMAIYDFAYKNGMTLQMVDELYGSEKGNAAKWAASQGLPAFAAGGSYQGGLALVGESGPEIINFDRPGQVYNATQTREAMQPAKQDNSDVVAAIDRSADANAQGQRAMLERLAMLERRLALIEQNGALARAA